jgi:hypothetical protein
MRSAVVSTATTSSVGTRGGGRSLTWPSGVRDEAREELALPRPPGVRIVIENAGTVAGEWMCSRSTSTRLRVSALDRVVERTGALAGPSERQQDVGELLGRSGVRWDNDDPACARR